MKKMIFLIIGMISRYYSNSFLEKIPKSRGIRDLFYEITNPHEVVLIKIKDKKIYVNSSDIGVASPLIKSGVYEENEINLFKTMLKPDTILIDIGANIGYYTLTAANKITEGNIYSFEPVEDNYNLLNKNVDINNYGHVKTFQKAISDKNGIIRIFLDRSNLGNHSLTNNNVVDKSNFVEVETITLDSFFNDHITYAEDILIKMDTQGAEGLVIAGAQDLLSEYNNVKIFMEFWPNGLRNMGTDPLELLNKLQEFGFEISAWNEKSKSLQRWNKIDIIDYCDDPEDGIDQVNLVFEKGKYE